MTKKLILTLIISSIFYPLVHSQVEEYDNEISASYGVTFFDDDEATSYNVHYSRFLTPYIGIKSGVSYFGSEFMNAGWGLKIPAYATFRTKSSTREDDEFDPDNTIFEDIIYSILSIIPANFELSIGPSFGYMSPTDYSKNLSYEQKSMNNQYYPYKKFAVTLDANAQICINIKHVGLFFNGGGGYWLTKNFKYYTNKPYNPDEGKTPRWNGQIQFGVSYKF